MKKVFPLIIFLIFYCFYVTSCYTYSGYQIKQKEKVKEVLIGDNHYILFFDFGIEETPFSTDVFQNRKGEKIRNINCGIHKKGSPLEKDKSIEITNAQYKLKNKKILNNFNYIENNIINHAYKVLINDKKEELIRLPQETQQKGYIGGYFFIFEFQSIENIQDIEYMEFDIKVTEQENSSTYHVHYDINTRKVFKIGSTLWEYWSSI